MTEVVVVVPYEVIDDDSESADQTSISFMVSFMINGVEQRQSVSKRYLLHLDGDFQNQILLGEAIAVLNKEGRISRFRRRKSE